MHSFGWILCTDHGVPQIFDTHENSRRDLAYVPTYFAEVPLISRNICNWPKKSARMICIPSWYERIEWMRPVVIMENPRAIMAGNSWTHRVFIVNHQNKWEDFRASSIWLRSVKTTIIYIYIHIDMYIYIYVGWINETTLELMFEQQAPAEAHVDPWIPTGFV